MTAHPDLQPTAPPRPHGSPFPYGLGFWLPLLAQAALILAVPLQATYVQLTSETVILQTAPVDPYNLFRGYYVTLGYDISNVTNLSNLPGGSTLNAIPTVKRSMFDPVDPVYVILEPPATPTGTPPPAWRPVAVQRDRPTTLPDNQVALRGRLSQGQIVYNLEQYYIPEEQRLAINEQIRQVQNQGDRTQFVVEVAVNNAGTAIPIGFWLQDQYYRF